jgi:LysM repeat protein
MKIAPRSRTGRHRTGLISRLLLAGAIITGVLALIVASITPPARPAASAARAFTAATAGRPGVHHEHSPLGRAGRKRTPVTRAHRNLPAAAARHAARSRSSGAGTRHATRLISLSYIVRPGDTLSAVARRFSGPLATWQRLYAANRARISDPDLIYPGQLLTIPQGQDPAAAGRPGPAYRADTALSGTLGCAGLEALWQRAGGKPSSAAIAASIAMAESSGNQYATGPAGERGYWQIHPDHGALSTYDPAGNARAAVALSADGTNWSPWTTYTSGAYTGRC